MKSHEIGLSNYLNAVLKKILKYIYFTTLHCDCARKLEKLRKPISAKRPSQCALCIASSMSVFHDEVEIEDFDYDEEAEMYYYPCPCGDLFEISKVRSTSMVYYILGVFISPFRRIWLMERR